MADITNLYNRYRYRDGESDLPILMLIHAWSGDANTFRIVTMSRFADYGFFVASPGMRGRNSADGSRDASAKEIYDIYDALEDVRSRFSDVVSATKAIICGYSGGGGNALAAACKFPDAFSCIVSYFGMSDYGYDNPDGWWYNNPGTFTADIEAAVGGTPAAVPNNYRARNATEAIAHNYTGGHLFLFHDSGDSNVPIVHSQNVGAAMLAAGLSNYTENYTDAEDDPRWTHGYPSSVPDLIESEDVWIATALAQDAWTVPASGTHRVIGYIKNKRYECWLGDGTGHVADVAYGTVADQYVVTPLTGEVEVIITQIDGKTATQTIDAETTITVVE